MHKYNFAELVNLTQHGIIKNNPEKLREIFVYANDIESQLWEGFPYVYSNMRLVIEAFCDYVIDCIGLSKEKIIVDKTDGMTKIELINYLSDIHKNNKEGIYKRLSSGKDLLIKKRDAYTLEVKIDIIQYFFEEVGVNTSQWALDTYRIGLNKFVHEMYLLKPDDEKTVVEKYQDAFKVMQIFYDYLCRDFIYALLKVRITKYVAPTQEEMVDIIEKYTYRLNKIGIRDINTFE